RKMAGTIARSGFVFPATQLADWTIARGHFDCPPPFAPFGVRLMRNDCDSLCHALRTHRLLGLSIFCLVPAVLVFPAPLVLCHRDRSPHGLHLLFVLDSLR